MIIGIDASRANLLHKTGTEWYSFYLIKNLAEIDSVNQYHLYLNQPARPDLLAIIKDHPNFSIKLLNWPFASFWTLGRLTLEMFWHRPDVLFVPAHGLPLFGPFKTVNTIHDLAFWQESNLYHSFKLKTKVFGLRRLVNFFIKIITYGRYRSESLDYLYWSTTFALRHAKKIIAVSENTKQDILKLYKKTSPEKIVVIHNGYDSELYPANSTEEKKSAILAKYGLQAPYLLYVGRLEKKKNTVALVEAFALLTEAHPELKMNLVLVGDASFGYDEIGYTISEYGLEDKIFLPGWVQEKDLPDIFSAAQAFIFPTKHEGFGIPILEAFACGVPTAVSDLSVLREIAGEAALYFNQNDKNAIAKAMFNIISDQQLRAQLIIRGRKRVQQFSWRKCAQETLKLLESL